MENFEFKEATPMEEAKVENKVITRDEAINILYTLVNSGILSETLEEKLREIADNIEMEKIGYHFWGADREENAKLFTAVHVDCITPEFEEECERIDDKYLLYRLTLSRQKSKPI